MTIVPDTKDWTWVLGQRCPECGLDARAVDPEQVPALLRANAEAWRRVLASDRDLRARPRPEVWSPLEYGCHVRDVFRLFTYRLDLMLARDNPTFPNWNQNETAISDRYDAQDPAVVAGELTEAGERVAAGFAGVTGTQWERTGARSDGAHFTVASFARYALHDPVHHLYDVTGRGYSA